MNTDQEVRPIHYETGAGIVRCGAPMRDMTHPDGWDMGNSTTSPSEVTCPTCLHRGAGSRLARNTRLPRPIPKSEGHLVLHSVTQSASKRHLNIVAPSGQKKRTQSHRRYIICRDAEAVVILRRTDNMSLAKSARMVQQRYTDSPVFIWDTVTGEVVS